MRLTVGPLPPAVYWRRRAVVLGGVLLLVFLGIYSCGGGSGANPASDDGRRKASQSPLIYPSEEPSEEPAYSPDPDPGEPVSPSPDGHGGNPGSGSGSEVPACRDTDLSITPRPARTETPEGARLRIDLVITNVSDRPCRRDIGADQQEIRLTKGAERIWSSDDCNPQRGSQVETLPPDRPIERFWVTWDGRTSAPKCEGDRRVVQEGRYSVVARLGNLTSRPVTLTVVGT